MGVRVRSVNNKALSSAYSAEHEKCQTQIQFVHRDPGVNAVNFQAMWASEQVVSMEHMNRARVPEMHAVTRRIN